MKSINKNDSFVEKLLFPQTPGLRVLYHVCFWILFILLHYAYAIPTLARKVTDTSVTVAAFLYFLKVIPEYYLCVGLYYFLKKYIKGFFLFVVLLITAILLNHILVILLFFLVDHAFGLHNMPERFQLFATLYMTPFNFRELSSWLVFSNDLSEAQFFVLPVALKIAKYAASENIMKQKLQNEALSMELKVLKSQINPHFVFNVLNAAYAKILPISEDAAEYLQKASEILRFSLYETNDEFIKLEKELSYLNQYVELESMRNNRRCKISLVQEGEVFDKHQIPTLLLITLVENAFKYGVHATRHPSYVSIRSCIVSDQLEFIIQNSKPEQPSLKAKNPKKTGGIGLANLNKRLQIYYPGKYVFEIKDGEKDFLVNVKIPLL